MVKKTDNSFSKVLKDFDPSDQSTSTVLKGILNACLLYTSDAADD